MPKGHAQKIHHGPQAGGGSKGDYVGVRLGTELRARAIYAAQAAGVPLSEWFRLVVASAVEHGISGMHGPSDPTNIGYLHGRALGLALAQQVTKSAVIAAIENVPMSIEEANARGMIPPEGYIDSTY